MALTVYQVNHNLRILTTDMDSCRLNILWSRLWPVITGV
jgi:hypothetical protein